MNFVQLRKGLAAVFRGIAYLSVTLQWLWLLILVLPPLMESETLNEFIQPTSTVNAPVLKAEPIELTGVSLVLISIITIVLILTTIVLILRLPKAIVETGDTILHKTTDLAIPVLTHKAHIPAKKRKRLELRVTLIVQLIACAVPAIISVMAPESGTLTREIII